MKLYYCHNHTFVMGSMWLSCVLKLPNVFNNVQTREIHKVMCLSCKNLILNLDNSVGARAQFIHIGAKVNGS